MTPRFLMAALAAASLAALISSAEAARRPSLQKVQIAPQVDVGAVPAYPVAGNRGVAPEIRAVGRRGSHFTDANGSPASSTHQRGSQGLRRSASTDRNCLTSDTRSVLEQAESRFAVTFRLVSTCRPGARIAGSGHMSEHSRGRAVDLMVPRGLSKGDVVSWFYKNAPGVTMVYRGMDHVHFDTGAFHKLACGGCGRPKAKRIRLARHP